MTKKRPLNKLEQQLIEAAKNGDTEGIQNLVAKGANPNCRSEDNWRTTPLIFASVYNHLSSARLLLMLGADANALATGGQNALYQTDGGWVELQSLLLEYGCNPNQALESGWTVLVKMVQHY